MKRKCCVSDIVTAAGHTMVLPAAAAVYAGSYLVLCCVSLPLATDKDHVHTYMCICTDKSICVLWHQICLISEANWGNF